MYGGLTAANEWAWGGRRKHPIFPGIFISTWSRPAVWGGRVPFHQLREPPSLNARPGDAAEVRLRQQRVGGGTGVGRAAQFVISVLMRVSWFGFWLCDSLPAFSPVADCYLCLGEISLLSRPPEFPVGGLCPRPWQQGTPKTFSINHTKGFLAWLRHVDHIGVSASMSEDERLPLCFLLPMCCAHASSADECPLLFCTGPHTHTHTQQKKKGTARTLEHTSKHPQTHSYLAAVTQTSSPQCAVTTFQSPQSSEVMKSGWHFRGALWCRFAHGFSDHIRFLAPSCRCFFFSPLIPYMTLENKTWFIACGQLFRRNTAKKRSFSHSFSVLLRRSIAADFSGDWIWAWFKFLVAVVDVMLRLNYACWWSDTKITANYITQCQTGGGVSRQRWIWCDCCRNLAKTRKYNNTNMLIWLTLC